MYPISASVGPRSPVCQESHKILFILWFAISGGAYRATNPTTPFWPVRGHYKNKGKLIPPWFCLEPSRVNSTFRGIVVAKLALLTVASADTEVPWVGGEGESRARPQAGSERSLTLQTRWKSDPKGTWASAFFPSQSLGTVPRPTLYVYLRDQVRPAVLFVFAINANLGHRLRADREDSTTRERLPPSGPVCNSARPVPRGCPGSSASLGLQPPTLSSLRPLTRQRWFLTPERAQRAQTSLS